MPKTKKTKGPKPTWRVPAVVDLQGRLIALEVWTVLGADPDPAKREKNFLEAGDLVFPSEELAEAYRQERIPARVREGFYAATFLWQVGAPSRVIRWA